MEDDSDDLRHVELGTLKAIYPEIRRPDEKDPFTFEIDLPVEPTAPVTVTFPAASATALPVLNVAGGPSVDNALPEVDSLNVSHLPSLCLRIHLPDGYPVDAPPQITISAKPQWLEPDTVKRLEGDGPRLWDEIGRDMVAFMYIDHVQQAAEDVFGTITPEGTLQMDAEHKLAVLDYDIKAKKAAFEKETFECGVCLDPKKGSKCHKMLDCEHIFCLQCLQDFYNDSIKEGNLQTVRCLAPNCAKERSKAKDKNLSKPAKKPKISISPSELLQIGLSEDMVKRYVTLKYKTELESDKNTIYCPRSWCNGAARSKRHKKPDGLEFVDSSDAESDPEHQPEAKGGEKSKKKAKTFNTADLLSVCEDCGFAFCARCYQSWHGEFVRCQGPRKKGELSEEEKASMEYLQLHTSPCPTCAAPAQKTHGCNHMICSRCDTHFCYLCSAWLDPANPYRHYNTQPDGKVTSCFMRLWELEHGDGDNVGLGFVGGGGPVANQPRGEEADLLPMHNFEVEDSDDEDDDDDDDVLNNDNGNNDNNVVNNNVGQLNHQGQAVAVAREAPLVLRLVDNQARDGRNGQRPVPPAAPDAPQPAARGHGPHRGNQGRGRGGRGGGRGGAGAGARGRGGGPPPGARGGGVGAVANRQRQNQRPQQPQQQAPPQNQGQNENNNNGAGLDAAQEAWVRRFVQAALIDEEDQFDGDSDDDGDNWMIQ
ncbi:RWD domain-containing protein [Thelonectria olida]|uniref:RBR-type E3 ubiquitin transferase n=1 Tax=Thelonectria olida TaxID=1576542 RepID=A0A9P9AU11_9HYPO|nr:RWD domain-containing protein [Thelonectria olida]